jgi:hypothetical protein
MDRLDLKKNG